MMMMMMMMKMMMMMMMMMMNGHRWQWKSEYLEVEGQIKEGIRQQWEGIKLQIDRL